MKTRSDVQKLKQSQEILESALIWAREVPDNHEAVDHIVRAIFLTSNRQYEIEVDRVAHLTEKAYRIQKTFGAGEEPHSEHDDVEGSAESSDTPTFDELQEAKHRENQ